jgi:hypothetical protein
MGENKEESDEGLTAGRRLDREVKASRKGMD